MAKLLPDEERDRVAAIETLRRGARLSEAMAACQDLLRQAPDAPRLLLLAATICRDSRQYSLALSYLDRIVAAVAPTADLYCDIARLRSQCGEKNGAMDAYRQALSLDPASASAHFELAELHAAEGGTDDAIYHLEVAIAVDPRRLDARERLAALMEGRGMAEEAMALRRETMHRARRRIGEYYTKVRTPAGAASPRALQRLRLSWAHALLVYGTAGIGVAKFEESSGAVDNAVATYRETLSVLAEGAEQARTVAGLRRAFATASLAHSQCHYELALLHERRAETGWAVYHLEEALRAHGAPWDDAYAKLGTLSLSEGQDGRVSKIREMVAGTTAPRALPASYPVTRWDFLRSTKAWLPDVKHARVTSAGTAGNRIAMLAANPSDIEVAFAVACVLVARGHRVDLLWWPGLHFDGACSPEPAFDSWDEVLMAREMEALAVAELPEGLKLVDLRGIAVMESDDAMTQEADRLAMLDVGRRRQTNTIYLADTPLEMQHRNRMLRNLNAMGRLAAYCADTEFDHLLVPNGDTMESGCAFWVARRAKKRVIVWERCPDRASAVIVSCNRSRSERDFSALWRLDEPHELSSRRRERVLSWLAAKSGGDYRLVTPRKRHIPGARSIAALADQRLDAVRPVVVLFGDRAAAVDAGGDGDAFPDGKTWVLRNIDFFGLHPEWQLIVRLYPQDGPSGIRTALRERRSDLPRNVSLIESSDTKLDYQLLDVAQLGLFRTSPIGLEVAMMGVVAVAAGQSYFCGNGFTRDTHDEEAYFKMVRRALENPESVAMTDREIELAWCFADLCVHAGPKPFPWSDRNFWRDVTEEWPMKRVFGAEGVARFGKVFAAMGGELDLSDGVVG